MKIRLLAIFLILATSFSNAYAVLNSGDILVTDTSAGTNNNGSLIKVEKSTGIRTLFHDFGVPGLGPLGSGPFNLAYESSGSLLVLDAQANLLFRVNPVTGLRTVLTNFSDANQGAIADSVAGDGVLGIAVEKSGSILVTAKGAGSTEPGSTTYRDALLRVNPATGQRTVLSDFGDPLQGPLGGQCTLGVTVEASGKILVSDCNNLGTTGGGLLFRIDQTTGQREVISDFGNPAQGGSAQSLGGVAVESTGKILVAAPFAGTAGGGALFRIDPATGQRQLLSDFGDNVQGAPGSLLRNVTVEADNSILVSDQDVDDVFGSGLGAVFRINPLTGQRSLLSDFSVTALGPGGSPAGLLVIPALQASNDFAAFSARLKIINRFHRQTWFLLSGLFTLNGSSDGINPPKEPLTLSLADSKGKFFNQTIPAGAFKLIGKSIYLFKAKHNISGIKQILAIPMKAAGQYRYFIWANKINVNQPLNNLITVALQIGNDTGTTKISCSPQKNPRVCR